MVPVGAYQDEYRKIGEAAFLQKHQGPALLLVRIRPGAEVTFGKIIDALAQLKVDTAPFVDSPALVFEVAGSEASIGRSRSADTWIPLQRISKRHAIFGFSELERSWFVRDLGSKNGSARNGAVLPKDTAVQIVDGDVLSFGPHEFIFMTPQGFAALMTDVNKQEALGLIEQTAEATVAVEELRTRTEVPSDTFGGATESNKLPLIRSASLERIRKLGAGGMADVYLARRTGPSGFTKLVAVKLLHPEMAHDRRFLEMFVQEARIAARIIHPNVVQIHDLGEADGTFYMQMEYVPGWDLSTILKATRALKEQVPIAVAARIASDAAAGLSAAFSSTDEAGQHLEIVHRDISPHNIMVSTAGVAKLADFGISRAVDSVRRTRPGEIKGKVVYLAPEQVDPTLGTIDTRSDIYALGLTLYEMIAGFAPLKRRTQMNTLVAAMKAEIDPIAEHRERVPNGLQAIIYRCLAKNPAQRYQTPGELHAALEEFIAASQLNATTSAVALYLTKLVEVEGSPLKEPSVSEARDENTSDTPSIVSGPRHDETTSIEKGLPPKKKAP